MGSPTARAISRAYLALALLGAIVVAPLPYSAIALALFVLQLYAAYRPFRAGLDLSLTFSTVLLLPLPLYHSEVGLFSTLLLIPALPLLDHSLKENALTQEFRQLEGRGGTATLKALAVALLMVFVASLVLANWALTAGSALLAGYLLGLCLYALWAVPRTPLEGSTARVRVVAGNTAKASFTIRSLARTLLHVQLASPYPWVNVQPARLSLSQNAESLEIALRPPLSGPSRPQLQAQVVDVRGLIQIGQSLEPVALYAIPRARYAEWLAMKFLGQAELRAGHAVATVHSMATPRASRRGAEYLSSRRYEAGDSLRDMDWKRTSKLNQIVVKEWGESENPATIIAANLSVRDAEEADRMAYNLITIVLTLAVVGAPVALAAYDHQRVLLTTEATDPAEALRQTLNVTQNMTMMEQEERFLQPPDLRRLKRNIAQLDDVGTDSARRLAGLLRLESDAIHEVAAEHPAAMAVSEVVRRVPPPATIQVVSGWNHDTEALVVTLDRLERQGYGILSVDAGPATKLLSVA